MAITQFKLTSESKLPPEEIEMLKKLKDRPINLEDIPELTDEQLKNLRRVSEGQRKRA